VEVDVSSVEKPRSGLIELVVLHGDHAFKVFIDSDGMIRRVAPIRFAIAPTQKTESQGQRTPIEVPDLEYLIFVFDDRIEVIDSRGRIMKFSEPLIDVLQRLGL